MIYPILITLFFIGGAIYVAARRRIELYPAELDTDEAVFVAVQFLLAIIISLAAWLVWTLLSKCS